MSGTGCGRLAPQLAASEVLDPLGMTESGYGWPEGRSQRLATGHRLSGAAVPPYVYPARASGGHYTTVGDVARFVATGSDQQQVANPVLTADSIRLAHTARVEHLGVYDAVADGYAFGHFPEEVSDDRTAVWHGGQGTGWMTHFHLVPQSGDGIVILTNSHRAWPLIGAVLQDWSSSTGAGSVQMSRITRANEALRVLLAACGFGCGVVLVRLVTDVLTGARRLAPLAPTARGRRTLYAAVGAATLGSLGWATAQPYLMVSSLSPSLVGYARRWSALRP